MKVNNKFFWGVFGILLVIGFILRFYELGSVPNGLYQDETAIGYNAFSILTTGKDEYGKSFPLYFKSFGDYKLPVYIYSTVLPVQLFGLADFVPRLPSAIFGFLTLPMLFLLVREMTKDKSLAMVSMGLLAINPWHLHYSRATFEVVICLFLFIAGSYSLVLSGRKKTFGLFLFGTILFIISLYGYNLTRLLSPLLYILVLWFAGFRLKSILKKEFVITVLVTILLLIPFTITLLNSEGLSSAKGTLITSSAAVQAPLLEFRSYLAYLPPLFTRLFFNTQELTLWRYLENIVSYFSAEFFFTKGSLHGNHGIGNVGQFYILELLFIGAGLFGFLKEKKRWMIFSLLWGVVVIFVASLTRESPHATRSFFLLMPFVVLSAFGLLSLCRGVIRQKMYIKVVLLGLGVGIFGYNILYYMTSYYVKFPVEYEKAWRSVDRDVSTYLEEHESEYEKVIFDQSAGFMYTSLLYYTGFSPEEFQRTQVRYPDTDEGFAWVRGFGKYEFREIDWERDLERENYLIVTSPENVPEGHQVFKKFEYSQLPVVVSVGQQILQYPVIETAYVLVQTK